MLVAGAILLIAHPALASARANYIEIASWETGYQAEYLITNDGPGDVPIWRVVFDLPAGSTISSSWDSVRSGSGQHLIFDNAHWNGGLPPGAHTSFGFVVVGTGRPVSCSVNGGPCDRLPPFAAAALPAIDIASTAFDWVASRGSVVFTEPDRGRNRPVRNRRVRNLT